jgi:2-polyprenyl-3-methyl-5-hydroxy-6-metoxy-1,4-benzoquinol methylase
MINFEDYPEHKLTGRGKLSFKWLHDNIANLLDGGCSYGYSTRYFKTKATATYGIDINPIHIEIAKTRYPDVNFICSGLEETGLKSDFFDAIVLNDVLEHTHDKLQTLNEMFRLLKSKGIIIISTPNKGLFGFLDPYNFGFYFRKYVPSLYKALYKIIRLIKEGKIPKEFNPAHLEKHWHYSKRDLLEMLNKSSFKNRFKVEKIFRSGLLVEVLTMNLEIILGVFIPNKILNVILKPFRFLSNLDYWICYGNFSYNIAMKIIKI